MQERDLSFDYIKGILIFLVVFGHCIQLCNTYSDHVFFFIYTFHMPLFALVSGYFSKAFTKQNLWEYGVKQFKHLISPHLVWSTFALFLIFPLTNPSADYSFKGIFYIYTDIWFLWFVFVSSVLSCTIYYLGIKSMIFYIFLSLFLFAVLLLSPNTLVRTFTFGYMYFFYILGAVYRRYRVKIDKYTHIYILIPIVACYIVLYSYFSLVLKCPFYAVPTLFRMILYILGSIILYIIIKKMFYLSLFSKLLVPIGQQTLGVYIIQHVVLFWILKFYIRDNIVQMYNFSHLLSDLFLLPISVIYTLVFYYFVKIIKKYKYLNVFV